MTAKTIRLYACLLMVYTTAFAGSISYEYDEIPATKQLDDPHKPKRCKRTMVAVDGCNYCYSETCTDGKVQWERELSQCTLNECFKRPKEQKLVPEFWGNK